MSGRVRVLVKVVRGRYKAVRSLVRVVRGMYHAMPAWKRGRRHLFFEPEQEGMRCWLIGVFTNRKGEEGPESAPISFVVT